MPMPWSDRGVLCVDSFLLLLLYGSRDQTQVSRLTQQAPLLLRHLIGCTQEQELARHGNTYFNTSQHSGAEAAGPLNLNQPGLHEF